MTALCVGFVFASTVFHSGVLNRSASIAVSSAPEWPPTDRVVVAGAEAPRVPRTTGVDESPLTLEDAIQRALERNPRLVALHRQVEAVRQRPVQAQALPPPRAEVRIWRWPVTTLDPRRVDMYMLTLDQALPGPGKRRLRAELAASDVELAQAALAAETRAVIDEVAAAYAELRLARRAVDLHRASVALLHQFADISQAKYASGRFAQHDVLKAVLELSALHNDLVALEARVTAAQATLNALLDDPPDRPIGALVEPRARVALPALADLERLALERSPALQEARAAVERAERELAVAHVERKPDLMVTGGYFYSPLGEDGWAASIGVTWPGAPWAKAGIAARVEDARQQLEVARARLRTVENAVRRAVHEVYARVQAAQAQADLLRTTILPESNHTLEVTRIAYQSDRVDFLALIDSQRALLDAQLEYVRALTLRDQALAELERVAGFDIVPDDDRSPDSRK